MPRFKGKAHELAAFLQEFFLGKEQTTKLEITSGTVKTIYVCLE